jgi:hypothetical protein
MLSTHFIRWWADRHSTDEVTEEALTTSSLVDYLRYQADQQPRPAASTINIRVWMAERALRCQFPEAVPPAAPGFPQFYWRRSKLGYGRMLRIPAKSSRYSEGNRTAFRAEVERRRSVATLAF